MAVLGPARKTLFQAADLVPWLLGGTLLWLGMSGRPLLTLAGTMLVGTAALLHLAAVNGFVVPRLGRVRIAAQGCWETPLAFFVKYRGHGLLFHRGVDPIAGPFPESYCVIALPSECDEECIRWRGFEPPTGSRFLGVVSSRDLRFEHRGGDYVDRASLSLALERISA